MYLDLLNRPRYFMAYFFHFCVVLLLSDFNMLDCTVFCELLLDLITIVICLK